MGLKLYFDLISQPSRTLYILLKSSSCPFEQKFIDLRKGVNKKSAFSKINKFKKVPVIDHNGFILTESVAIMKYLARENLIPESLFPKESKAQAKVDEFLSWQYVGLRLPCTMFFRIAYLEPLMSDLVPDHHTVMPYFRRMEESLDTFETMWLGRGQPFLLGQVPTVADLVAACEIEQTRMANYELPERFENINVWREEVIKHFNPHYQDGHSVVNDIISSQDKPEPIAD